MHEQQGFVMTRGMMMVIGLIVVGFIVWLVVQGSNQAAQTGTNTQGQPTQQEQLSPEEQIQKNDIKTKEDLERVASAITEFVSNNSGIYPTSSTQLDDVMRNYIRTKPFLSPLTQNSYVLSSEPTQGQGVINLQRGTCNSQKNGVVPTENTRTYAVLTLLTNKSAYCIDI